MLERSEIKERARNQVKGNIGVLFLIGVIYFLVTGMLSFTGIGAILVAGPFMLSFAFIFKGLSEGKSPKLENLFDGFKNNFAAAIIAGILQSIFLVLWSFLFFIPGIIKSYSYYMTFYILADEPDMTALDAITESRRIMNGHKFRLFVQHLSFLGWIFVGILTLCIGFIWIIPYMTAADYNFYLDLKEEMKEEA